MFLFAFIKSEIFIDLEKNITSLLNTKQIKVFNNLLIVGTEGGIYKLDENNFTNISSELIRYNISSLAIKDEYLWIGNKENGIIQILDNNLNFSSKIDYIPINDIYYISFSEKFAFVLGKSLSNDYVIIQYSNENNNPYYLYTISNIPNDYSKSINSIAVIDENLFLATSEGLLSMNKFENINFFTNDDWVEYQIVKGRNINSLFEYNNEIYITIDNGINKFSLDGDFENILTLDENIHSVSTVENNKIAILTDNAVYLYDLVLNNIDVIIHEINEIIVDFLYFEDKLYFGLKNFGIKYYHIDKNLWGDYIPNTIYNNHFDAISLSNSNHLVGLVNHKYSINNEELILPPSGGFILTNPLSNSEPNVYNFYSYNGYHTNSFPLSNSSYNAEIINYWSGDNAINSCVINSKDEVFFSNSGIYPPAFLDQFKEVADYYSFELSDETQYGGVVEFKINSDYSIYINDVWNRSNNHLGGQYGILNQNSKNGYMIVNQIIRHDDNIWVLNPYSEYPEDEYINWPITLNYESNYWYSIKTQEYDIDKGDNWDEYDNTFIPKEMVFDKDKNLWICYMYYENYSPGGIRMLDFNNITKQNDDVWKKNYLNEYDQQDIFSIAISNPSINEEILWLLTGLGLKGYKLNKINFGAYQTVEFVDIYDDYFFSGVLFSESSKIRIDNQENIWVTTDNDGLRVLKSNGEFFDSQLGEITIDKYGILSNNINDIIFDDYGNIYIATDYGISILESSFTKDVASSNISVSPNPFIIGEDSQIIISNVSRNSTIKIMNLSGYVVKEFNLSNYNKNIPWNGCDEDGNRLGTGVYLVTAYSKEGGIGSTKIAMINK